jgi:hypothetical protein
VLRTLAAETALVVDTLAMYAWSVHRLTLIDVQTGVTIRGDLVPRVTVAAVAASHVDTLTIGAHPCLLTLIHIIAESSVRREVKSVVALTAVTASLVDTHAIQTHTSILCALIYVDTDLLIR